jgi:hypothetical protein
MGRLQRHLGYTITALVEELIKQAKAAGNGKAAFQLARSLLRCRRTRLWYNHIRAAGMNVRAYCAGRTQGAGTSTHDGARDVTARNSCHYWQRSYR